MAKKIHGQCCICGKESKLTFEHIPPRAAFNYFNMKLYDFWDYLLHNNTKYQPFQRGAGKYSLCASCNNLTGEWYGSAYAEFASQGMSYFKSNSKGIVSVPYTIYPLRVFKQIVSCFASVNGAIWCEKNPEISMFLLNPHEKFFPAEIDIRMYMQEEARSKFDGISGQMNVFTGERFMGSEWSYPPFSYIMVSDKNYSNYRSLNELFSIREFLKYNYDDRVTLYMNIPRKPCNPTTLDFRAGIPALETIIKSNKNENSPNSCESERK